MNAEEILTRFENFADLRKLNSARRTLEEALEAGFDEKLELVFNYNLGTLYWSCIGDGVQARRYYKAAAQSDKADFVEMTTNAIENMMILSTSYEEYFDWADKLKDLMPSADILVGQYPDIEKQRDAGTPWYEVSYCIATTYYNRNDQKADKGMYACAASIYQIQLSSRKEMRISMDYLKTIFFEYLALMYKVVSQAVAVAQNKSRGADPEDYMFMIDQVLGYVSQYSEVITFDDAMNTFIDVFKEWRGQYDEIEAEAMRSSTSEYRYDSFSAPMGSYNQGPHDIEIQCPYCGRLNSIDNARCRYCALPLNQDGVNKKRSIFPVIAFIGMVVIIIGWLLKWW